MAKITVKKETKTGEWVENLTYSFRPKLDKNGAINYKLALQYLTRIIDQDLPNFEFILNLASFATTNKLSDKQRYEAIKIIQYYIDRGIL